MERHGESVRPLDLPAPSPQPQTPRPPIWPIVLAAIGVAAIVLILLFVGSEPDPPDATTVPPPPPTMTALWTSVPEAPVAPKQGQSVVWTGEEVLAWGGAPESASDTGGAAFDPEQLAWRRIAPAPDGTRDGHAAVWTGTEMLVWGGVDSSGEFLADGLRYDPASDEWEAIPAAPIAARRDAVAVWTGDEMIVLGGFDMSSLRAGVALAGAAAFDPASGSWRRTADVPVGSVTILGSSLQAVWTGDVILATGGSPPGDAAVYQPASDTWEVIDSPLQRRSRHTMTWTGTEVIVVGGSDRRGTGPEAAAWNPATGRWRTVADVPGTERGGHGAAWTGEGLVVWGGSPVRAIESSSERLGTGLWYDADADSWSVIDGPSLVALPTTALWTGEAVFVWNSGGLGGLVVPAALPGR